MAREIPPVLDACCGSRMFWFNRNDGRALFVDKRREKCVADTREGRREIVVDPDFIADFTALPFPDATFTLVVFDPPHTFSGTKGWMAKKYGSLSGVDWREEIRKGFAECFRVLAPLGTLIFKWNEHRIPVSTVLSLTREKPLFGQRCGSSSKTHWIVFMKSAPPTPKPCPCGTFLDPEVIETSIGDYVVWCCACERRSNPYNCEGKFHAIERWNADFLAGADFED